VISELTMSNDGLVLWRSSDQEPIAARVAVAGDFLPAGKLELPLGHDWGPASKALAPHFKGVWTSFVNLECSIDANGLAARSPNGLGQIVSAPSAAIEYLVGIRCGAIGFANNHSYDFGGAGVERTRRAVERSGLSMVGAGHTSSGPPDVHLIDGPCGIKIGLWAAAKASHELATRSSAGVEPASIRRAVEAIGLLKTRGAAFSVALLHAGVLRANRPDPSDLRLMDEMAQAGFDVVAASHSHRISGAKLLRGKSKRPTFCFYGLGSLVSGFVASPEEREGLVVVAGLNASGAVGSVEVKPVWLADSGIGEVPAPEISLAILGRFRQLSAEIPDGSFEKLFYQEISRGLVKLYLRDIRAALRQSGVPGLLRKGGRIRMRHLRRIAHGLLAG